MNKQRQIAVLGGGVSGITTALTLRLLGYQVDIITEQRADRPGTPGDPAFASLYPSASVIPHSTHSAGMKRLFTDSQNIFHELWKRDAPGMTVHKHYELFEFEREPPGYTDWLKDFRPVSNDETLPRRPDAKRLHGWQFTCFFAEWPLYMPQLFKWFEQRGGGIILRRINTDQLPNLPYPVLVNCTGLGAADLMPNEQCRTVERGHLVKIAGAPLLTDAEGNTVSYNYTPRPEVYTLDDTACDVYCYPRRDGWILGGSRLRGTVRPDRQWHGPGLPSSTLRIGSVELPEQIITLNGEIIRDRFGIDMSSFPDRTAYLGDRYTRHSEHGIRIEVTRQKGKPIIHNYGHGGAGVTLSWGSAVAVARKLGTIIPPASSPPAENPVLTSLGDQLESMV